MYYKSTIHIPDSIPNIHQNTLKHNIIFTQKLTNAIHAKALTTYPSVLLTYPTYPKYSQYTLTTTLKSTSNISQSTHKKPL